MTEPAESAKPKPAPLYTVKQYIDTDALKKDLSYSIANLSEAMSNQSALFVHYGVLLAKASRQVDELKMLLETVEAKVARKIRDSAATTGTKVTEGYITASVAEHPTVLSVTKSLNEAKQIEAIAKTAVEGFRHRRDMLVQMGLLQREEMKGDVSIARRNAIEVESLDLRERVLQKLEQSQEGR